MSVGINIGDALARSMAYYYGDSTVKSLVTDVAQRTGRSVHEVVGGLVAANLARDYFAFPLRSSSLIPEREALNIDRYRADSRYFEGRYSIFLSYRRHDALHLTDRVYDKLCSDFGELVVFRDIHTLELGAPFRDELRRVISTCRAMVVLIGKDWLARDPATGRSRLMDEYDPVRMELLEAHKNSVPFVICRTGDAPALKASDVPECLSFLAKTQSFSLESDTDVAAYLERVSSQCYDHLDNSTGPAGLRLPIFSKDIWLSLQLLTVAALGIARLYKHAMADPMGVLKQLGSDPEALFEYERIAVQWSFFLGKTQATEYTIPDFVSQICEILTVCFDEMSDEDWNEMSRRVATVVSSVGEESPDKYSMAAASASGLLQKRFCFLKRHTPVDAIVPRSPAAIQKFVSRLWSDQPSIALLSCPRSHGLSDAARVVDHLVAALESAVCVHVRGSQDIEEPDWSNIGAYLLVVDSSFVAEVKHDAMLSFLRETEEMLKRGVPILPVLTSDAPIPRQTELPPTLRRLFEFTVLNLQSGTDVIKQVERVIAWTRIRCRPGSFLSESCPPSHIPVYGEAPIRSLVSATITLRDALIALLANPSKREEIVASNLSLTEMARSIVGVYAQHLGLNIEGDTEFQSDVV